MQENTNLGPSTDFFLPLLPSTFSQGKPSPRYSDHLFLDSTDSRVFRERLDLDDQIINFTIVAPRSCDIVRFTFFPTPRYFE